MSVQLSSESPVYLDTISLPDTALCRIRNASLKTHVGSKSHLNTSLEYIDIKVRSASKFKSIRKIYITGTWSSDVELQHQPEIPCGEVNQDNEHQGEGTHLGGAEQVNSSQNM